MKTVLFTLFLFCLLGRGPEFELLSAGKCRMEQGRPEMGKAYTYEVTLVNHRKVKDVNFQYIIHEGVFIPLSHTPPFEKINRNDTLTLKALRFANRSYSPDSVYLECLNDHSTGVLFLHKGGPCMIELDGFDEKNCRERRKRM